MGRHTWCGQQATPKMKISLLVYLLLFVIFGCEGKTRQSCKNVLANKIVSFESNYFPGNQLEPVSNGTSENAMGLPSTQENELIFKNDSFWRLEKRGNCDTRPCKENIWIGQEYSLSIVSMKKDLKHTTSHNEEYYLSMISWAGGMGQVKSRITPRLDYFQNMENADPRWYWTVQFDIECEDCATLDHCYISNRYRGSMDKKNYGRTMADDDGVSIFGYLSEETNEDRFDWTVHVHRDVDAGAAGPIWHQLYILFTNFFS